ncbi:SusD/RagB family nutrient-binding outer membrane lipoprotein [Alistipes sp.]|uniref:SusD/RagB family nutrient-binding outer membrane lipoprotein n=1 Tax=Alistipes sp. TaxID=1872444 RepID=UPI0025B99DE9|nr:SusD/RagB family nutrient-binding outer membrane lipoprotein [Alistipes sp.]
MKNINRYILMAGVCTASLLAACDYEQINTNPFEVTDEESIRDNIAVGGMVLSLEKNVFPVGTQADDTDIINAYQVAYHLSADIWSGYFGEANTWDGGNSHPCYYLKDGWVASTYDWAYTKSLDPWKRLKASSEQNKTPEVYALAQILKISAWHKAVDTFGPIPYSHAADNTMKIFFDSEEEVYTQMLEDLSAAIGTLKDYAENGIAIMPKYDAVYGGDAKKWVKYANSLMLRLAMRISSASPEKAKQYAEKSLDGIGVMTSKDDEAKMATGAGMNFINNVEWLATKYGEARMGSTIYSYLMGYEDPRLSKYFLPAENPNAVKAYDGQKYMAVPSGHTKGGLKAYKECSLPNFTSSTPTYWLRTSEVLFLKAEAALKWGGKFGDAKTNYEAGVKMSFEENGVSGAEQYLMSGKRPMKHSLSGEGNCDFAVPSHATTSFDGGEEEKLEKIMIQKYLAMFPNGHEAWTDFRRTGYPKMNPVVENRGSSIGITSTDGIRRMKYPESFYQTSEGQEIYDDAVQKLGGLDNGATNLWWAKK